MKMSSFTFKNETSEELLICQCCLSKNRKLYSLHDVKLLEAYKCMIGNDVTPYDGLPPYICNYCSILLLKYMAFRENCWHSRDMLLDAKMRGNIIPTDSKQINLHQTTIKILSIYNNNIIQDNLTYNVNDITKNENSDTNDDYHDHKYDVSSSPDDIYDRKVFSNSEVENSDLNSQIIIKKNDTECNLKVKSNKLKKSQRNKHDISKNKNTKTVLRKEKVPKKGKYFETKENMERFEREYCVDIIVLSKEEQMKDVLDRKLGLNYLHSPYKCQLCYKGYMDVDILNKHVSSQHDPSRGDIVCEFCRFRYKDKRGLTQHLKSHRLKFACRQCTFISRTTFNAKEHFKMHGGHLHQCKHCGKSYEKLSSHLSHMRIHHPSELSWCELCGEAFIGEFGLNAHTKRAHRDLSLPEQCSICKTRFVSPAALRHHAQQSRDCGATCRNCCVHCGQSFEERILLRDHLIKMHRNLKIYACEKCDKTFTRESLYSAHYRRLHVDSEEIASRKKARPWVCEVCGKTLPNKCVLLYHQRTHTGERPYQCTQCPKSFTMRRLLQSHLRVHTTDRPYSCKSCPKTFKGLSALRTHEHIHSEGPVKLSKIRRMAIT